MKLKFAPAKEADRAFFVGVHHTAYRRTIEEMFGWEDCVQDKFASDKFDQGGINIVLRKRKRVGVVGWEKRSAHLWLKEVFVLPIHQHQGIGGAIISHAKDIAREHAHEIRLRTLKANLGAKTLYQRHGFAVRVQTH